MAIYTQSTANSLASDKMDGRVADYLYELNENLSYMFNNLSPEENYSEDARLIYVQRGKRIGTLEVRADAIELKVQDDETNYNTSMQLFADLLKLTASTPTGSSTIAMTGDKIELTTGKFIVNSTNLQIDAQGNGTFSGTVRAAQIISSSMSASTISGGTITGTSMSANEISGGTITGTSMSASSISGGTITGGTITGGTISGTSMNANTITGGTITGTTINGGTITGTSINGGDTIRFKARPSYVQIGDFEVNDDYDRHILQSYDEVTGMSTGDADTDEYLLWAGWNGTSSTFAVFNNGDVRIRGTLYINGETIDHLIESYIDDSSSSSGGGDGGNSPGGTPSGGEGEGGGPTGDENDPLLGG